MPPPCLSTKCCSTTLLTENRYQPLSKRRYVRAHQQCYRGELDLIFKREDNGDVGRKREPTQSLMLTIEWLLFHFVEWSSVYLCFPRINYYLKSILLDNNYTLLLEHKYGLPSWLTD